MSMVWAGTAYSIPVQGMAKTELARLRTTGDLRTFEYFRVMCAPQARIANI